MTRPKMRYDHPPCVYVKCAGPVVRRDNESLSHFKARGCCSPGCALAHSRILAAATRAAKKRELEAAHPPCVICGGRVWFHRKREESYKFIERKTCGKTRCIRKLQARSAKTADRVPAYVHYPDAPMSTEIAPGEYGAGFGAHNIEPPLSDRLGKVGAPPFMRSYGVVSYAGRGG